MFEGFESADIDTGGARIHVRHGGSGGPLPERMIGADPDAYYRHFDDAFFDPEAVAAYRRAADDPATIHAMCEDYRAGAGLDVEHDLADKGSGRRIACPLLALWGARWHLEDWYDVLAIWRDWAPDATGRALDCGHYVAEERPEETLAELRAFFAV